MLRFIRSLSRDERGVSALEYAILAGIIVAAVAVGVGYLSTSLKSGFSALSSTITSATTSQ